MKITKMLVPTFGLLVFASGLQAAPSRTAIMSNYFGATMTTGTQAAILVMSNDTGCDPTMQQDRHNHHGGSN